MEIFRLKDIIIYGKKEIENIKVLQFRDMTDGRRRC
jgi:hypothetical protein